MSTDHILDLQSQTVTVVAETGGWVVQVIENGEKLTKSFSEQRFAESFADGQRSRLNLIATPSK